MHRQNSGSQRFLKNFAKRAQEVDQNYIVFFFQKKNPCPEQTGHFGSENIAMSYLWICSNQFF